MGASYFFNMQRQLPSLVMDNLLKKAGVKRIGESAKSELKKILNERIEEVTKKAASFSAHAGRKTITKEDIELAVKSLIS